MSTALPLCREASFALAKLRAALPGSDLARHTESMTHRQALDARRRQGADPLGAPATRFEEVFGDVEFSELVVGRVRWALEQIRDLAREHHASSRPYHNAREHDACVQLSAHLVRRKAEAGQTKPWGLPRLPVLHGSWFFSMSVAEWKSPL